MAKQMTVLSNPANPCILLIDPLLNRCEQLAVDQSKYIAKQFSVLEAASNIIGIPRYFSISDADGKTQKWLSRPCEESNSKVFEFSEDKTPWSNLGLVEAIKAEKRERLFICGFVRNKKRLVIFILI